jgi:hypothetical protein
VFSHAFSVLSGKTVNGEASLHYETDFNRLIVRDANATTWQNATMKGGESHPTGAVALGCSKHPYAGSNCYLSNTLALNRRDSTGADSAPGTLSESTRPYRQLCLPVIEIGELLTGSRAENGARGDHSEPCIDGNPPPMLFQTPNQTILSSRNQAEKRKRPWTPLSQTRS